MKKKTVGLLIGCLMVLMSVLVLPGRPAYAADYNSLKNGDIVEFGSYPQKLVTDSALISNLNGLFKAWRSYPYYSKNMASDAKRHPSSINTSIMMYADFSYQGKKYRAVQISKYRPYDTTDPADGEGMGSYGNQASQGYTKGTYYFEYQPIRWIIVNKAQGLLVSEKILDSQPFNAYYYSAEAAFNETQARSYINNDTSASDYYYSTVRYWLNGVDTYYSNYANFSFIGTAFSTDALKNALYTTSFEVVGYDKTRTATDNVFLLDKATVNSVIDSTGNAFYPTETTDYARAQGVSKSDITWRLRDKFGMSTAYFVRDGLVDESLASDANDDITATFVGIRPAIRTNLNGDLVTKAFQITVKASSTGAPVISWPSQTGSVNYRVYRCPETADKNVERNWTYVLGAGAGVSSATDTTAEVGKGYYYRVALIQNNQTTYSNNVAFDYRVQAPVITYAAPDPEYGKPVIRWTRPNGAETYYLERRTVGGNWSRVVSITGGLGAEMEHMDRTATTGYEYEYRIQASAGTDAKFDSNWSNVKKTKSVAAQPTDLTFSDTADGLPKASWHPPVNNRGIGYRVRYAEVGSTAWTAKFTKTTSFVLSDAVPGKVYNIKVTTAYSETTLDFDSAEVAGKKACVALPEFTKQTQDTVTFSGKSGFTLSVTAQRAVSYKWYVLRWSDRQAGYKLEHTCTDGKWSFTPTKDDDGMKYYVAAVDKFGREVNSDTSSVLVLSQPAATRVNVGDEARFTVETIYPTYIASYQWQSRKDANSEWTNSGQPGAKTATLKVATVAGLHGWQFRCVVKDKNGNTVVSNPAKLTLVPKFTAQPKNATVEVGTEATFTVGAIGKAPLSYQWQSRKNASSEWSNSGQPGAKTATLKVTAIAGLHGWQFRCVVTDGNGQKWGSNPATLTVVPKFTTQPKSVYAAPGTQTKLTAVATGKAPISYQWQSRKNSSSEWSNSGLPGAKTSTLTITASAGLNGWQFRCVATDGNGQKWGSAVATLFTKLGILKQPTNTTASAGTTAKFTVTAYGKGTLKYQWQSRKNSSAQWTNSGQPGAKTATLQVNAIAGLNGWQFRCIVTDGDGNTLPSAGATLAVK